MTFGPQVGSDEASLMVRRFLDAGHREIDSAFVYNSGDTERMLGGILPDLERSSFSIATKVNPRISGRLDGEAVQAQLRESLERMNLGKADILYFHFPDPRTPVEGALEACAELHSEGLFDELGLSNFAAWQVIDIWHICRCEGWPTPSVYQGLYNGLSRGVESELIPALRWLGMRFCAYNPLAGGILAGRYRDFGGDPSEGRFTERPNYRNRYWKKPFFDALEILRQACEREGASLVETAFRWLASHSALDPSEGDAVILGASSLAQLEQNLSAMQRSPLPEPIVSAFDAAWEAARPECPSYFRSSV
ncbi:aldo/keto reductase family protein [Haloferula sp. A504]|uniref:aldo/keto reductase family protein n=1 Tax=Haloferula sp. A504 TaxID=3373601 RepID=UPI0031C38EF1|nr:aldo/keto reductase [Verrucomicrobiaceae bacterium E54]